MKLSFLNAPVALTKSYTKLADGTIEKSSYPNVWEVTSIAETANSLKEFEQLIIKHAALGNCLLKGLVSKPLVNESRAGTTDRNAATDWLCLDIDGIDPVNGAVTVETILTAMGLGNVSYILQWSGSMGITSNAIRCHVFILLAKPMSAPLIKQWLIQMNHEVPVFKSHQALTKTGNSLTWGLDITACQADKLIYIAPPVLKGIKAPLGSKARITLVQKANDHLDITSKINGTDQNRVLTDTRVLELRDRDGLPKRKITYKTVGPHEVMVKPGECIATEMKIDRGFVYFNINGGDSWAYFHPESNPDFIFNFKGEPVYLTKDLLPAYWESLQTQAYRVTSSGLIYLAFLNADTSDYYRGKYDPEADALDIKKAKNETMVRQYADSVGMRLGANIPEWTMSFDPNDAARVDFQNRTVNTFVRTKYMKAVVKKTVKCPPKIFSLVSHFLAYDLEVIEHYFNWLAYIVQFRTRTRTAWVLQGTFGTGKGIFFEHVLQPLFGSTQAVIKRAVELEEKYTGFVENKFIVFIDEIEVDALHASKGIISSLKSLIANREVSVRVMHKDSFALMNYANFMFSSNATVGVTVPKGDRRFNIAPRQDTPFPMPTDEWLESLADELQAFHDFLMCYAVDKVAAATPLDNEARTNMIAMSQTTAESTASALIDGDIAYFVDQLPTDDKYKTDMTRLAKVSAYRRTLFDIISRTRTDGSCNIARDELFVIFDYTVGNMNPSPTSFTKYLGHRQIEVKNMSINQKSVRGIQTTWANPATMPALIRANFADLASTKPKAAGIK